jgi:two-component system, OmpR family, response regulator QseB
MRFLLVEDDRAIGSSLRAVLAADGHAVDWVRDLSSARSACLTDRFDVVLLDLNLPERPDAPATADGLLLLRELRARGDTTPVIILTARETPLARVDGLDSGADDYLVKPFEVSELSARIRAVTRRHHAHAHTVLQHGPVELDTVNRQVRLNGEPVLLSAREFAVLDALMQRPGAVLTRAQLEDRLYGWRDAVESNAVSVYVHQLRRKLGADFIGSMRGVGYFLRPIPEGGAHHA